MILLNIIKKINELQLFLARYLALQGTFTVIGVRSKTKR